MPFRRIIILYLKLIFIAILQDSKTSSHRSRSPGEYIFPIEKERIQKRRLAGFYLTHDSDFQDSILTFYQVSTLTNLKNFIFQFLDWFLQDIANTGIFQRRQVIVQ